MLVSGRFFRVLASFSVEMRLDTRNSILVTYSTEIRVASLIGCFSTFYFRAQITTNQRRQADLCGATSSVWNFSGPISVVSQAAKELNARKMLLTSLLSFCHSSRAVTEMLEKNYKIHCSLNDIVRKIT